MKTSKRRQSNEPNISPDERAKLMAICEACLQNASDLLEEAELLAEHKKYARAVFLGLTALEEIGKGDMVADYAHDVSSIIEVREAFRFHSIKVAYMARFISLPVGAPWQLKKLLPDGGVNELIDETGVRTAQEARQNAVQMVNRERILELKAQGTQPATDRRKPGGWLRNSPRTTPEGVLRGLVNEEDGRSEKVSTERHWLS